MTSPDPNAAARPATKRAGDQANRIADILREEIVSGVLQAGAALRQEHLAELHQTSRMPVRDALRLLESEGLVQLSPNKGAIVSPLDPAELREVYEMRAALETLALRLAIPELTNSRIDQAAAIQDNAEASGLANFSSLNKSFHSTLYEPCGRPRLLAQIAALNDTGSRYLRLAAARLDYVERSHLEHRELLLACRQRDMARACDILEHHIEEAGNALYRHLTGQHS
jgi:DNA-binding GntR family transcriptional regulator